MQRFLVLGAAIVLIVVAAIVQGTWSERWDEFPELQLFADRVKDVPLEIGDWKGEDLPPTDAKVLKMAGAVGSLSRTFKNPAGDQVSIFVVCGKLRDVFYHAPDRCYPAQGFEMMEAKSREALETSTGTSEFFTTTFQKSDETGVHSQRIYWSFTADGAWIAPENESVTFFGERALYKVYVVTPLGRSSSSRDDCDPAAEFIRVLVPALTKAFFPEPQAPATTPVAAAAEPAEEKS